MGKDAYDIQNSNSYVPLTIKLGCNFLEVLDFLSIDRERGLGVYLRWVWSQLK
jgi:hypothetical protein